MRVEGGGLQQAKRKIHAYPNLTTVLFFQSEGRWYTGKVLGVSLKLG